MYEMLKKMVFVLDWFFLLSGVIGKADCKAEDAQLARLPLSMADSLLGITKPTKKNKAFLF